MNSNIDSDTNSDVSECIICLEQFDNNSFIYPFHCKHRFHNICYNNYKKHKYVQEDLVCPICKSRRYIMYDLIHIFLILSCYLTIYLSFLFGLKYFLNI